MKVRFRLQRSAFCLLDPSKPGSRRSSQRSAYRSFRRLGDDFIVSSYQNVSNVKDPPSKNRDIEMVAECPDNILSDVRE